MSAGPLTRAVGLRPGQAAAAAGAGGKTSLLEALAAECHAAGWGPVLFTTTTKIFSPPEADTPLLLGEAGALSEALGASRGRFPAPLTLARRRLGEAPVPGEPGRRRMKLEGFAPEETEAFRERAGVLLIEADGARGLPIKAPGPEEPLIPRGTDIVLGVVGLKAIGAPLNEAHAFRSALLSRVTGVPAGSPISPEAIGRLALHPDGLFRGAPLEARRLIVLNQADVLEGLENLKEIAYIIWDIAGAPRGPAGGVLCVSLRGGVRVACRIPTE